MHRGALRFSANPRLTHGMRLMTPTGLSVKAWSNKVKRGVSASYNSTSKSCLKGGNESLPHIDGIGARFSTSWSSAASAGMTWVA